MITSPINYGTILLTITMNVKTLKHIFLYPGMCWSPNLQKSILYIFRLYFNDFDFEDLSLISFFSSFIQKILIYSRTRLRRTTLGDKKKYVLTEVRLIRMHNPRESLFLVIKVTKSFGWIIIII